MRIVCTRLDKLGDLLLSTPAIRSLRRSYPQARLTLLCSTYNKAAVERNPDIDELLVVTEEERPRDVARRVGACDLALALAPRTRDLRVVGALAAPRRVGYTYARRFGTRLLARFVLTDSMISDADPLLSERDASRPVKHEVEQLLQLCTLAGARELVREIVLVVDDDDRRAVRNVPAGAILLHLAPRWFVDGSTEASVRELLRDLRALGRPLALTHAAECAAQAERLATEVDHVASGLTFAQWAAAFERAGCVVTVDTGATHVASAMRRPTAVLFEHRYFNLNSREWAPYGVPAAVVRKPENSAESNLLTSRKELRAAVERLIAA